MASVREKEIEHRVIREYFSEYDWTKTVGDIDVTVCSQPVLGSQQITYLWAEAKQGTGKDIYESLIQLIITVGKAKTYERELPPYFLGAFDAEKIAFVEYSNVMHVFSKTDFNWNVTPSDHGTKEFKELYALLREDLKKDVIIFKFAYDEPMLKRWLRKNFKEGRKVAAKMPVNKNNFTYVYYDWVKSVKPSIVFNWGKYANKGVLDCDFFLADLMSVDDMSLRDRLKVVLERTKYRVLQNVDGDELFQEIVFNDGMAAYHQFWNRYERPPKQVYQRYILDRHDLLVPQDIREVKGSYYTPERWVRKAHEYLEAVLGENWQDEYFIWDCSAGSGNLLRGLTNKYNIFASTLDDSDVKVMHDAIAEGRLNLVAQNVFQFDFLNDGFEKCPESLRAILADEQKRKRLVLLNNPPYKDVTTADGTLMSNSLIHDRYTKQLSVANRELFAQFLARMYFEIPSSTLAVFSTLKTLQGSDFSGFRAYFQPRISKVFLVPADTFDNVDGDFPIAFQVFDTKVTEKFSAVEADVYDRQGHPMGTKVVYTPPKDAYLSRWVVSFKDGVGMKLGWNEGATRNDFQHNNMLYVISTQGENNSQPRGIWITENNLIESAVAFSVRQCMAADWLNDRDQFMVPKDGWQKDVVFQGDCLVFLLFHGQNRIMSKYGVNHWIPFYEDEVRAVGTFGSRFMADYLHGRISRKPSVVRNGTLFDEAEAEEASKAVLFDVLSPEAREVLDAGRELWCYYMSREGAVKDASFYDIKEFFQGRKVTKTGKEMMNSSSPDVVYNGIMERLKNAMHSLAAHIEPKVYEYGFLYD